jgi:hypothetical protein
MKYYVLKPEAAGDFGPNTIFIDMRARPALVKKFHYEFSCWLGDPIVEAVTSFIVTEAARDKIIEMGATGAAFDSVEISTTYPFEVVCKGVQLPTFVWLQITGKYGEDDFGFVVERGAYLVISDRVLHAFLELGLHQGQLVELEHWKGDEGTQYRRAREWSGGQP